MKVPKLVYLAGIFLIVSGLFSVVLGVFSLTPQAKPFAPSGVAFTVLTIFSILAGLLAAVGGVFFLQRKKSALWPIWISSGISVLTSLGSYLFYPQTGFIYPLIGVVFSVLVAWAFKDYVEKKRVDNEPVFS